MTTKMRTDGTGLDDLDPSKRTARDASHFRSIVAARDAVDVADARLREAVSAARAAGEPWSVIGAALGVTKQAAQQRFSREDVAGGNSA